MSANRTTKSERRRAKLDAIQWNGLNKWSQRNGRPLVSNYPPPGFGIAAWARHLREEPVRLSVKITVPISMGHEPSQQ